jgi:polypeptide N-acetylgalactosaminyltransferase
LISRIAEDRTRVVCPVIDIISDDTFAYVRSFELHWGAFNWELHFRWYTLGGGEIKKRKEDITEPFRYSPGHVLDEIQNILVHSGLYFEWV